MSLKTLGFSLLSLVLGIALSATTSVGFVHEGAATNVQDDRVADREAICAHIDSIFQASSRKVSMG